MSAYPENRWNETDWEMLLLAIEEKKCTPFLGAGACHPTLPLGAAVSKLWARKYGYPFDDDRNLARVAQYVSSVAVGAGAKLLISTSIKKIANDRLTDVSSPHRVLASLRLPLYITTNYDSFMSQALSVELGSKPDAVKVALCNWHLARKKRIKADLQPTSEAPVVFHLHGHFSDPNSIVITEDDYLEFMSLIVARKNLIPTAVEEAFGNSAFLFIGYALEDINFKVIFQKLAQYFPANSYTHAAVQLNPRRKEREPTVDELKRVNAQVRYLEGRFEKLKIKIYWGTAQKFVNELSEKRATDVRH
jgi:hypothetical protein